jgi:hypothetical protein
MIPRPRPTTMARALRDRKVVVSAVPTTLLPELPERVCLAQRGARTLNLKLLKGATPFSKLRA